MDSLLPPNATAFERALEQIVRTHLAEIPVELIFRRWDPAHCPAAHLGWLAWDMSVDFWQADWPDDTKRAVIRQSVPVHRHKGTLGSLRTALEAEGYQVEITEADYYRLILTVSSEQPLTPEIIASLNARQQAHKAARSTCEIRLALRYQATHGQQLQLQATPQLIRQQLHSV